MSQCHSTLDQLNKLHTAVTLTRLAFARGFSATYSKTEASASARLPKAPVLVSFIILSLDVLVCRLLASAKSDNPSSCMPPCIRALAAKYIVRSTSVFLNASAVLARVCIKTATISTGCKKSSDCCSLRTGIAVSNVMHCFALLIELLANAKTAAAAVLPGQAWVSNRIAAALVSDKLFANRSAPALALSSKSGGVVVRLRSFGCCRRLKPR